MKTPFIEFTGRPARYRKRLVAGLLLVGVLCSLTLGATHWHGTRSVRAEMHSIKQQIDQELARRGLPKEEKVDIAPAWLVEAEGLLRHDWNELLTLVESIELDGGNHGLQLVSLQASAGDGQSARLEYQLSSWEQLAQLTQALQQGEPLTGGVWVLQSASVANSAVSPGNSTAGAGIRATWQWERR